MSPIENRYDFCILFDIKDGNPNGDPDAGNLPRVDPETGDGLVSDVCLKRKIRNYVQHTKEGQDGFEIFIRQNAILNNLIEEAHTANGKTPKTKVTNEDVVSAREYMCKRYYDVRAFGAVMSTGMNAGQVRGPVQLTFSRSEDPIVALEHAITRMAVATEQEAAKEAGANRTMGRKTTVPYGLYKTYGFVSAQFAKQTGFSSEDLDTLWAAIEGMFEEDRSAARGLMACRRLIIFRHESPLGNAPAHHLLEGIQVKRTTESPPRSFADYEVVLPNDLPTGVSVDVRGR